MSQDGTIYVLTLLQEGKEFHVSDIAMPSSKGMTRYKAIELFKHAMVKKDERLLKEVYQYTLQNNLPAYSLFGTALTVLKAESTREFNDGIDSINDVISKMNNVTSPADIKRIQNTIDRMVKENNDRKMGMIMLDKALLDWKVYEMTKWK